LACWSLLKKPELAIVVAIVFLKAYVVEAPDMLSFILKDDNAVSYTCM
jgi:hypothetical protein